MTDNARADQNLLDPLNPGQVSHTALHDSNPMAEPHGHWDAAKATVPAATRNNKAIMSWSMICVL